MTPPRPVRPRDAASLVVLRGRGPRAQVLLGRRASRHRFLPNVYVFPGGRLDRADLAAEPASPLQPAVAERLAAKWGDALVRGLAVAAVRETFEETGLAFGRIEDGRLAAELAPLDYLGRAITPSESPIRFHARFFLAPAEAAGGGLRDSAELSDLRWFSLAEALALPLADVTEFMLQEIARRLAGQGAPGAPVFCYRGGRARIRYE